MLPEAGHSIVSRGEMDGNTCVSSLVRLVAAVIKKGAKDPGNRQHCWPETLTGAGSAGRRVTQNVASGCREIGHR